MNSHTHRGHCQVCLRTQAIDTESGRVAIHGYQVLGHSFVGDCAGSNEVSLHISRVITNRIIASELNYAAQLDIEAAGLRSGKLKPVVVWTGQHVTLRTVRPGLRDKIESVREMISWEVASQHRRDQQVTADIYSCEQRAKFARDHATRLQYWADRITGKVDAYRVEDLEVGEWKVGDVVRIGGKKGFDATIEAIEDKPYRTSGFRQGSRSIMCPHARITSPAVTEKRVSEKAGGYVTREARAPRVLWEPLRNIKRPPNALAAMLKKEGVL